VPSNPPLRRGALVLCSITKIGSAAATGVRLFALRSHWKSAKADDLELASYDIKNNNFNMLYQFIALRWSHGAKEATLWRNPRILIH
jgi:hypothetical protein